LKFNLFQSYNSI